MSLAGKTVIISGASRGQGATEAQEFARLGCHVYLCDVRDDEGEATATAIREEGHDAVYMHLDVTQPADWSAVARAAVARTGGIHVLVNNAGIAGREVRVLGSSLEDWDRMWDVNLKGPLLGIRSIAEPMRASGGGSVINIGSAAALTGHFAAAYSATKWALRALTKSAALELGSWNIRVNTVHPGVVDTTMVAGSSDFVEAAISSTPARRIAQPKDVAGVVLFLASDEGSFVNGVDIAVDGGFTEFGLYWRIANLMQSRGQQ